MWAIERESQATMENSGSLSQNKVVRRSFGKILEAASNAELLPSRSGKAGQTERFRTALSESRSVLSSSVHHRLANGDGLAFVTYIDANMQKFNSN